MKIYARIYQLILRCGSYLVPWNIPHIISGANIEKDLANILAKHKKILIVTDQQLMKLNLLQTLFMILNKLELQYFIYDGTSVNPTIKNIEEAKALYLENHCDGMIAFGGGSPIDCAKAVGASIVRPNKPIKKMKGLLKIRRKLPFLCVIPTTAGTGSETTIAAVITDEKTHEKYAISDLCLIPGYAVLDPKLTINLPKDITATTGIDALTHAIEAYIGKSNTKGTRADALKAIKLIYENLYQAYAHGHDIEAREKMQYASFYAGKAFTRAYVGNVHAIAHALGGFYGIPHGLANAVVLPYVLHYYGEAVEKDLAFIADYIEICPSNASKKDKSEILIAWIEDLSKKMNIPTIFPQIKRKDIEIMSKRAYDEANPLYPVPMIFSKRDFTKIYLKLQG